MKLRKWDDVKRGKLGAERAAQIRRKVEQEILDMNLAELRQHLGVTQATMAEAAGMAQSELSRVERREDHLVSTLRRCVQALGGELEITAHVGGKRVRLHI